MNSGMPAKSVATIASPWLAASMSTFGRPSRSPDRASFEGRTKRSASRRSAITSGWALAPRKATLSAMPARSRLLLQGVRASSPPPTWAKRQWRSRRQGGERLEQIVEPLLGDGPADARRCGPGRRGSEPSRAGRLLGRRGKAGQIEPVIDERHPLGPRRAPADARRPAPCRSRPRGLPRSSRASPSPASSRCPWRGPRRSRSGRSEARRSGRRRRGCAGNARAGAARPPAARGPSRRPGRGGARGSAVRSRLRSRQKARIEAAEALLAQAQSAPRSTRRGSW